MTIDSREGLDDHYWQLEQDVHSATVSLLSSLGAMNLEYSVRSQAVREFSQAFSHILGTYRNKQINYEVVSKLVNQIWRGFHDGSIALMMNEANRKIRNEQRAETFQRNRKDSSYRRNIRVNNETYNVRFLASCATPECFIRNANYDLYDDAFQDYVYAATQDKRSDIMQIVNTALIVNPYLKALGNVALIDSAYSVFGEGDLDPLWSTALGKAAAYRLRLLNFSERAQYTTENAVIYIAGEFLGGD